MRTSYFLLVFGLSCVLNIYGSLVFNLSTGWLVSVVFLIGMLTIGYVKEVQRDMRKMKFNLMADLWDIENNILEKMERKKR